MFLFKDVNLIQNALKLIMLIILMTHCSKEHTLMMLYWIVQGRKVWKRNTIGQCARIAPLILKAYIKIPKTLMHIIIICIINAIRRGMPYYVFYYCRLCMRYVYQPIFDVSMPLRKLNAIPNDEGYILVFLVCCQNAKCKLQI